MGAEPKEVAAGSGWSVHRLGRSYCIAFDSGDAEPVQVWLRQTPNDITRGVLLASLVAGAHGAVDHAAASEAMGANW